MATRSKDGHGDKGVSLARGPALVMGSILLTIGLLAFLADGTSPTDGFPDGTISDGKDFFGFEVNDWTAMITAAAGGLLLFGATQHLLSKTMSLIVGLALGACSVIALVDGDDVFGLAAANGLTALLWGVAAAILLINALLPRKGGKDKDVDHDRDNDRHREPVAAPRRETVATEPVREERVTRVEEPSSRREGVTDRLQGDDRDRGRTDSRDLDPRDQGRSGSRDLDPRDERRQADPDGPRADDRLR